jgi:hypothetical protein
MGKVKWILFNFYVIALLITATQKKLSICEAFVGAVILIRWSVSEVR